MYALKDEIHSLIHNTDEAHIVTEDGTRIFYRPLYMTSFANLKDCKYYIIHYPGNKIYTNTDNIYEESNIEKMQKQIEELDGKKVYIVNGTIKTDSKIIQENWETYKGLFKGSYYYTKNQADYYSSIEDYEKALLNETYTNLNNKINELQKGDTDEAIDYKTSVDIAGEIETAKKEAEGNIVYVDYNINDFAIVMSYKEELNNDVYDTYMINILKIVQEHEDLLYASVPICGILVVTIVAYLILAIGYKKGKNEIELNDIDKIPIEIIIAILFLLEAFVGYMVVTFNTTTVYDYYKLFISASVTAYLVTYVLVALTFVTIVKRIKTKTLIRNSITWRIRKTTKQNI